VRRSESFPERFTRNGASEVFFFFFFLTMRDLESLESPFLYFLVYTNTWSNLSPTRMIRMVSST
jgi:hypothetical protein